MESERWRDVFRRSRGNGRHGEGKEEGGETAETAQWVRDFSEEERRHFNGGAPGKEGEPRQQRCASGTIGSTSLAQPDDSRRLQKLGFFVKIFLIREQK
jgi:hypothetical protein